MASSYELIIKTDPAGSGSISPAEGVYNYPEGEVINIKAQPGAGYKFDHWTGDVTGINSASTTLTVNSAKTITAHFIPYSYVLGDADGSGEVNIFDALEVSRYIAGLLTNQLNWQTSDFIMAADVNKNGVVDIADAIKIARYDIGFIESLE